MINQPHEIPEPPIPPMPAAPPETAPAAPDQPNSLQLRRLQSMLGQITQLAKESSLTGCFQSANSSVIEQYNRILSAIEHQGVELHGLFAPLGAESSFDEVGVTAAQLFAFLEDDVRGTIPTPPVPPIPPAPPTPFQANFDFNNLENLKGLGAAIRQQVGQHFGSHWTTTDDEIPYEKPKKTGRGEVSTSRETRRLSDFRDANLSRVEFSDVDLSAVSFRDVNMNGAQFHDVNLAGCQFEDANFAGANFHDVNFAQTVFRDVNFNGVALLDCEISGLTINGIAVEQLLRKYREE